MEGMISMSLASYIFPYIEKYKFINEMSGFL